ncbi:MAG: TldD/PmbA family protein [Mycobacteriales bacterium]
MSGLGHDRALALAEAALATDGADGVEVVITASDSALTRYADSRIHQNTARVDGEARIRVVVDGDRIGVVATNDLSADSVARAARAAVETAQVTPRDATFAGFAQPAEYADAGAFDEATASLAPAARAEFVAAMLAVLPREVFGSGAVESGRAELAVANSNGVRAYAQTTRSAASILAAGETSTGFAEATRVGFGELDADALAERAARKVEQGRNPRALPPGDYAVVLEPAATATLVEFLCWTAFSSKEFLDGRSPFSGRLGEQVCDPRVTIVDDALSPLLPGVPFDFEGVPKRRLPLIDKGVVAGVTHDLATAHAAGVEPTGHGLPAPNADGGYPLHPMIDPGDTPLDDLIAGLARGLIVTRFHYTNVVNPMDTSITGMTRDGTFLVEDGAIVGGVHNLRFTQSILAALSSIEAIGSDTETASELFFGCCRAPALRLSNFRFTSSTTF